MLDCVVPEGSSGILFIFLSLMLSMVPGRVAAFNKCYGSKNKQRGMGMREKKGKGARERKRKEKETGRE